MKTSSYIIIIFTLCHLNIVCCIFTPTILKCMNTSEFKRELKSYTIFSTFELHLGDLHAQFPLVYFIIIIFYLFIYLFFIYLFNVL